MISCNDRKLGEVSTWWILVGERLGATLLLLHRPIYLVLSRLPFPTDRRLGIFVRVCGVFAVTSLFRCNCMGYIDVLNSV